MMLHPGWSRGIKVRQADDGRKVHKTAATPPAESLQFTPPRAVVGWPSLRSYRLETRDPDPDRSPPQ